MIVSAIRFRLALLALAAIATSPAALHSQSERTRDISPSLQLPDAPQPQATVLAPSEDGESRSSSSLGMAVEPEFPGIGQTSTPAQTRPLTDEEKKKAAEEELQIELKQRMGGIVPNFNAVLDGSNVKLTPKQKMRAAFRSAIDPYQVGLALLTSGIGQAEDSHDTTNREGKRVGYGQGWEGYGKRFGAGFTDQFDGTILGNGVFPILLKQDARYFRMGTGTTTHRLLYSMSTTVRCKGDNGKWQPNYSNLLGNLAAGGISNLYYPAADRGFGLTIEQGLLVTAEGTFGALLIEFYPDIRRHFSKKHQPSTPPASTAPAP